MGATSVTGLSGPGASRQGSPNNQRNHFVPMRTPHVVAAGVVTLAGGVATITFPKALDMSETEYVVFLTNQESNTAVGVTAKNNTDGQFTSFEIAGANEATAWMVVNNGFGLDLR